MPFRDDFQTGHPAIQPGPPQTHTNKLYWILSSISVYAEYLYPFSISFYIEHLYPYTYGPFRAQDAKW